MFAQGSMHPYMFSLLNILTEACGVWHAGFGLPAISLSTEQSDLGVSLLGHPILGKMALYRVVIVKTLMLSVLHLAEYYQVGFPYDHPSLLASVGIFLCLAHCEFFFPSVYQIFALVTNVFTLRLFWKTKVESCLKWVSCSFSPRKRNCI